MAVPPLTATEEPNVARGAVACGELGLLGPRGAALHEDVGGTLTCAAVNPVLRRTDDGRAAAHGHGGAEPVARRAVACGELGLLGPRGAAPHEDEGGTSESADDGDVAAHRHGAAEPTARPAIVRGQRGLLGPGRPAAREDEGGAWTVPAP